MVCHLTYSSEDKLLQQKHELTENIFENVNAYTMKLYENHEHLCPLMFVYASHKLTIYNIKWVMHLLNQGHLSTCTDMGWPCVY